MLHPRGPLGKPFFEECSRPIWIMMFFLLCVESVPDSPFFGKASRTMMF